MLRGQAMIHVQLDAMGQRAALCVVGLMGFSRPGGCLCITCGAVRYWASVIRV